MLPAYYLEFEGMNSFIWIWVAGILFFLINIAVIAAIMDSYVYTPWGQIYQKSEWDFPGLFAAQNLITPVKELHNWQ